MPTPAPTAVPKPERNIAVLYKNANHVSAVSRISPVFKIINRGNTNVKLEDIQIQYYYTNEGGIDQTFWCNEFSGGGVERDSSQVHGSFLKLKTPKDNADYCLRVGFYAKAGVLRPGESVEIAVGFSKNDGSLYQQEGDYSYNNASNAFISWERIAVYMSGKLVSGREP